MTGGVLNPEKVYRAADDPWLSLVLDSVQILAKQMKGVPHEPL